MATRYTNKALCADIAEFNRRLEAAGADCFLEVGSRYNYTAVDVLTLDNWEYRQGKRGDHSGCLCNLETGSPRECYAKAETFFYQQLAAIEKGAI